MSDRELEERDIFESRKYELLFAVRKSVRYHDHRRSFYLAIEAWLTFFVLVLGSGATINALNESGWDWARWAAPAAIAVISAASFAIRPSRSAALHSDLYTRFARLEKQCIDSAPLSASRLDDIQRERLDIEIDEPATYQALNRTCHNEILRSMGRAEELEPLRARHRILKNLWRFNYLPQRRQQQV